MPLKAFSRITSNHVAWFLLALALAFSTYVRCRLASFPLERDEGEYAYAGQLLLQGIPPYSLAYNMKLPGTYLAYAGLMAVFGETTVGIHLGVLFVNLASIALLFFLTRELFDSITAAVAALVFAILSTSATVRGMAGHATHFVTLFAIAGSWVLWRARQSDKAWLYFATGLLLGTAFLMKQQGMFFLCFGGLIVLMSYEPWRKIISWRHGAICASYGAGAILPFAICCLWLWLAGTFPAFWFWTFDYARAYVNQMPLRVVPEVFWLNVREAVAWNWPIWSLAAIGAIILAFWRGALQRNVFVWALLFFSFLCVCPGFYFRSHYFIVMLPAIAILAAIASVALTRGGASALTFLFPIAAAEPKSRQDRTRRRNARAPVEPVNRPAKRRDWMFMVTALVPACVILHAVSMQRAFFFQWSPSLACREVYGENPFVEAPVIADYIRDHSNPDDRIAILGSEPEIFFHARRRSASGYIYVYPLVEPQPFAPKMQDDMIAEIEAAKPEYFLMVNVWMSWLTGRGSEGRLLDWSKTYMRENYRPVGLIDIPEAGAAEYKWDADAVGARPRSRSFVWVLRRRS